jgi:hypothetical protein
MNDRKPPTHIAYTPRRDSRAVIRWLEIGTAHIAGDVTASHDIFIDRLPTGGFSGHIRLSPVGDEPSLPELEPSRPARMPGDEEP